MGLSNRSVKLVYRPVVTSVRRQSASARFAIRGKLRSRTDLLFGIAGIGALIAIWCLLTYGGFVRPVFLPTPTRIWRELVDLQTNPHHDPWLLPSIWRSFWRVTRALFLVILVGVPIGVLIGAFPQVDAFVRKIINGGKAVPISGLLGLTTLWFGFEEKGMVIFIFLGAIFFMIILVKNAVASVNEEYLRVALDVGANKRQVIWRVLLPGALPQIWDAIAVCNGIMWTYIILAELFNGSESSLGLGYLIHMGQRLSESGKVYGALIIIALISSITDFGLLVIRKRFLNW
jgi:NitT/TauT family transport system permease protein